MEFGVRDANGLSPVTLSLSQAALHVMALMNGENTCEAIQREFHVAFDQPLATETLQSMIDHLQDAHFLEGPAFESYYQSLVDEYCSRPVRPMRAAEAMGHVQERGGPFDELLEGAKVVDLTGPVAGIVAPHLDYPRGGPCYASAYITLADRSVPNRVVILGTNHFGRSTSIVATTSDFATPSGTVRTDTAFVEQLEDRCGHLRTHELDHAREHSIELQIPWLQRFFGANGFQIVPILCPDPCGPTGTRPNDGRGVDLHEFAVALGELITDDPQDTLIVAGADLSHVGAAFGDERRIDETWLAEVRDHDQTALSKLVDGDPAALIRFLAEQDNPTHVCGAGCLYALAVALPGAKATILDYHQAVDEPSQTCVTCAAVVYT